jgi:hypothetical protein
MCIRDRVQTLTDDNTLVSQAKNRKGGFMPERDGPQYVFKRTK